MALILCVDDSRVIREMLRLNLERLGHKVLTAEDGRTGLQTAAENPPDAVVLDYDMPGLNGAKLAAQIKAQIPAARVMMLSGSSIGAAADSGSIDRVLLKSAGAMAICTEIEAMLKT